MHNAYPTHGDTMNNGTLQTHKAQLTHLVESNLKLVQTLAKYIISKNQNCFWLTEDDLLSAGYEALVKAAHAYHPKGEASFETYASHCIKNEMLAEIKRMFPLKVSDKQRKNLSIVRNETDDSDWTNPRLSVFDEHQSETMNCDWDHEQEWLLESLDEAMERINREELELVHYRYGFEDKPMTLSQLAEHYQKTQQAVHKRLSRVHDKLSVLVMEECFSYSLCA